MTTSKLTKAQLIAENNALRAELDTMRMLVLQAQDAVIHATCAAPSAVQRSATPAAPAPRTEYEMPAWQVARAQQMAAAKQAAVAMRCVIKV